MNVLDKTFRPFLSAEVLNERIKELATQINKDYIGKNPIFIGILGERFEQSTSITGAYLSVNTQTSISFWSM